MILLSYVLLFFLFYSDLIGIVLNCVVLLFFLLYCENLFTLIFDIVFDVVLGIVCVLS
ncbi:hypothetical protein PPACK8108_LOCUS12336, partial [Phakopsora pachyrhizi]